MLITNHPEESAASEDKRKIRNIESISNEKAKGNTAGERRKKHPAAPKHLMQAKGPPVPIISSSKDYMDPDKIPDSDCDLSGFDPELMRAYEEWADDYFGQLRRGLRITVDWSARRIQRGVGLYQ